jgi:hypothetical protein
VTTQPAPEHVPAPAPAPAAPDRDATGGDTDTGTPSSSLGLLEDGSGFVARLGPGFRVGADILAGRGWVDLPSSPQPVPGAVFTRAAWRRGARRLDLKGRLAVPHLDDNEFTVRVDSAGTASFSGEVRKQVQLAALGNPRVRLGITEQGSVTGTVQVQGLDVVPRALRRSVTAEGEATVTLADGRLSGSGGVDLAYPDLGTGRFDVRFGEDGRFAASGTVHLTPPMLDSLTVELAVDEEGNITGTAELAAGQLATSVPGLSVTGGTVTLGYSNGAPSGSLQGLTASYAGLGTITFENVTVGQNGKFSGDATFSFQIPQLSEASGRVRFRDGKLSGEVTLGADKFPESLPVRRPSITARYRDGVFGVSGSATVDLGPAGEGTLSADWSQDGVFSFGGTVDLTVPGLDTTRVRIDYQNGAIEGEVEVALDSTLMPGLDGTVTVRYRENRWSGETTLDYSADDGKLSGSITVTVTQTEQGELELGGSGRVTAQIAPRLQGTLTATVLPEGGLDVSGTIEVTEPLELFPEERVDKELFRHSQNIPLWGILVAVIRARAGVRAGIGPGVFRDIRVEGSYTIGAAESDPSLSISGELFIPAFVEGYVAFGAGLGVDVVLGSLTGGIEGVATAGIYGAISVVPELSYADGDWGIEGTATLAAGARLKLGLNAWAEIEALWVTVWEEEWKLAEYVMPIGPDLGLQAKMSYKFGSPAPPELEFNSSDIDTESLIQSAMPKDGPAGSGAREALENKAEWQGALREQRQAALPPEVAAEANQAEQPPEPAPRPPRQGPGGAGESPQAAPGVPGAAQSGPGVPGQTPPSEAAQSQAVDAAATPSPQPDTVPAEELPGADQPRYPGPVTLQTLEEPPAPLPRTADQEREDLDAARRVVELASAESSDSDRLDNYFPTIKERFRLTKLGYEGDFTNGFEVVGEINPKFSFKPDETLSGTGIPGDLQQGRITEIGFKTDNIAGHEVGVEMEAKPLGPEHPQGSGPSEQVELMKMLPTDPSVYRPAESRYIRGHLLNDNLGGPGRAVNLFPITALANSRHHSQIESQVKKWVNERKLWTTYKVQITGRKPLRTAVDGLKSIDATVTATASVLNTKLQPVQTLSVSVLSQYQQAGDEQKVTVSGNAAAEAALEYREADDIEVQLSTTHPVRTMDRTVHQDVTRAVEAGHSVAEVAEALKSAAGFGDAAAAVLVKAYGQAKGDPVGELDLTSSEKGTFSRIVNNWSQLREKVVALATASGPSSR